MEQLYDVIIEIKNLEQSMMDFETVKKILYQNPTLEINKIYLEVKDTNLIKVEGMSHKDALILIGKIEKLNIGGDVFERPGKILLGKTTNRVGGRK